MRISRLLANTVMFVLVIATSVHAQDLKAEWEKIQAEFLGGMHDSVVTHIRPFIAQLQERNLRPQLSVAYFHYAVSLSQIGQLERADSMFEKSKELARASGQEGKAQEIESKQIQLYLGLAKSAEQSDGKAAMLQYTKALRLLGETGDPRVRAAVLYNRGLLARSGGDVRLATEDFEHALPLARGGHDDTLSKSLVSLLTELYVNAGQSERAQLLAEGTTANTERVEYSIRLAGEAESRGDWKQADQMLRSIQADLFATAQDDRIVEFVKKRYSLYDAHTTMQEALDTLRSLTADVPDARRSARVQTLNLLALALVRSGNVAQGNDVVRQMRKIVAGGQTTVELAARQSQTEGDIAYLMGKNDEAIRQYRSALHDSSVLDLRTRLSMLNNLGLALTRNGQEDEARSVFDAMYLRAADSSLSSFRIQADLNEGIVLIRTDRLEEATMRFKRAKALAEKLNDVSLQIMASMRLAESYRRGGYDRFADEIFEDIRIRQQQLTNPFARIQVLQALATNAKIGGNRYTALVNLLQAYRLATEIGATGLVGPIAIDLGDTYFLVDSIAAAENMYRTALKLYADSRDVRLLVEQHYKLGQCALTEAAFDRARKDIEAGLALLTNRPPGGFGTVDLSGVRNPDLFGQGLANLGFVDFTEGRHSNDLRKLLAALSSLQKSVEIFESRKGFGITQSEKETEAQRNVNAYRLLVDIASYLYKRTGDPKYFALAFDMSEKSRAEAFVTDVGAQLITKLHDPGLKELSTVATRLIGEQEDRRGALVADLTTAGQNRGLNVAGSGPRDDKTLSQYDRLVKKLSAENNKAAQLVTVNTMNLSSASTLLAPDEALLDYYVSIDKVYLFAVTKAKTKLVTINWTPEEVTGKVEAYRSAVHDIGRDDYRVFGRELYDSLVAPVNAVVAGKKLLIVPSGRLNNLPFGGLMDDTLFLAERYEISVLPNVSTLQFIRTGKKLSATPTVFALGNPDNPRVTRLPGTEREVNAIKSIYPTSVVYLGDNATESIAKRQMGGFDIIHIASHGLFNAEYPLLSSLALTPDADNDGFLEVHELYNMNLTNTKLVILSACETGLSQIKKNDDVIGLVRGFIYAGVPSTLASLWKVDDAATASLMSGFHLLLKLGNSKGEALRKAQEQLMRTPATRHPYYWAAFVLYGSED